MWREFIQDYFSFTSKERKGILFIIPIILILFLLPFFFQYFIKQETFSNQEYENEIAQLETLKNDSAQLKKRPGNYENEYVNDYSLPPGKNSETIHAEVFYFDPNTASDNDWKRLGVKERTIRTIQKYISKGGKFYKPEDIGKIWGIPPSDMKRLLPYVRIKNNAREYASEEHKNYLPNKLVYAVKTTQVVDINLGDTSSYISLPGIGTKLSQRIIAFRDKLGGFYSTDQVGETYLLPDSTFQKIKKQLVIGNTLVKKININTASVDEMKKHPYLRFNIANAIFQYRQQHGDFNSVEEIKKSMVITDEIFNKVFPYLSIK